MDLIIARGIPGSGKSTAVRNHFKNILLSARTPLPVCSADMFFGANYKWSKELTGDAHKWCQLECKRMMLDDYPVVYIDNTNIKRADYQVYVDLAERFKYNVKLLEPHTEWHSDVEECFKRNTHNVPKDVIQRMNDQFELDSRFETLRLFDFKGRTNCFVYGAD